MKTHKILSAVLLFVCMSNTIITQSAPWYCAYHSLPTESQRTNAEVAIRSKYDNKRNKYGVTYEQLKTIIENASKELVKQRSNYPKCQSFEHELEENVVMILEARGQQHHAIKALTPAQVREKVEQHELKLRQQYGKKEQREYYNNIPYQQVVDIIKGVSNDMFRDMMRGDILTTEAQLADLFRNHTDAVLAKLNKYRNR